MIRIFLLLFKHQWQKSLRSVIRKQQLAANTFVTILVVLLFLNILGLMLSLDIILKELFPGADPVRLFNGCILYYLIIDLILRYLMQRMPDIEIYPYMLQPVKRSILSHYLIFKSFFTLFNILPLLILLPFLIKVVVPAYSLAAGLRWFASIYLLVLINSLLTYYLKKTSLISGRVIIPVFLILTLALVLDINDIIPLSRWSGNLFFRNITRDYVFTLGFPVLFVVYYLVYTFITRHMKFESDAEHTGAGKSGLYFMNSLNRMSRAGTYLALELKLLFRNKRPRSTIYSVFFLLVICLLLYLYLLRATVYYPEPVVPVSDDIKSENKVRITFYVQPDTLPNKAHVYITGNHDKLGRWHPGKIPLKKQSDNSWTRTFFFNEGEELKFKVTLGTWQTERLEADGSVPREYMYNVEKDSTLLINAAQWNKAPRSLFIDINLIYFGVLIIGMMMMMYGQFIFSWESNYFELLNILHLNLNNYLRAKYLILSVSAVFMFVILLPFIISDLHMVLINGALLLYNLGINTFLLLFLAFLNRKRIDLNANLFSMQGKGNVQFLSIIPFLFVPVIILIVFGLFDQIDTGYITLAILGAAGICAHSLLINVLVRIYKVQRYKITTGFRNS